MPKITSFIATFVMIGLFAISLLMFATNFSADNSTLSNISSNDAFGDTYNNLNDNLNNFSATAQDQKTAFQSDNFIVATSDLIFKTIPNIAKTLTNTLVNIFDAAIVTPAKLLGIPPVVYLTVTGLLLVGIIFIVWRSIKTGD